VTAGRVIVLSRDRGLATVAGNLVDHGQALARFVSPAELPDWLSQPVAAVVLDFPRRARGIVYRQLRQRYRGPVLALLEPGETSSGLPTDRGRVDVLHRPFQGEQLSALLSTLTGTDRDRAGRVKVLGAGAPLVGPQPALSSQGAAGAVGGQGAAGAVAAFSTADPLPGLGPRSRSQGEAIAASIGATLALPPPSARMASGAAVVEAGPATTTSARGPRRRRGAARLQVGAVGKLRLKGLAVVLGASAALLVGIMLSGEPGCRAAGCGIASAIGTVALPPGIGPGVAASPGAAGAASTGKAGRPKSTPAGAGTVTIPIASGVGDLLSGTSSSSGGAPLLVVGGGSPPSPPGGSGGGSGGGVPPAGGGSGGVPPATTNPPGTTSPPGTVPPTTPPPTTAPPTDPPPTTAPAPTDPPTTAPPPTDPPTTAPPPATEPPTTEPPPTTAAVTA
jgi:hypothetical protein